MPVVPPELASMFDCPFPPCKGIWAGGWIAAKSCYLLYSCGHEVVHGEPPDWLYPISKDNPLLKMEVADEPLIVEGSVEDGR
jgi:hypothetical protein